MITHAIVTKVSKLDKNKEGVPYTIKTGKNAGKPYWRVGIKTDKTGDEMYWGTAWATTDREYKLKEGDECQFLFETKDGFKNFKLPSIADLQNEQILDLQRRVGRLEQTTGTPNGQPNFDVKSNKVDEINEEDIPFD